MAQVGRPTKYTPEVIATLYEYLKEAIPENMSIPTVEGLALKLDVSKDTLYEWGKEYPEFSDALSKLKITQKECLTKIGIFGGKEINASIVQLFLKVNHDMIETDRHLVETKGSLLDLDDNGKTDVHTVSTVPAETN